MAVFLPSTMLPKFILSLLNYLTTDLDGDAFELPFPFWWVDDMNYFCYGILHTNYHCVLPSPIPLYALLIGFHLIGRILMDIWQPTSFNVWLSFAVIFYSPVPHHLVLDHLH